MWFPKIAYIHMQEKHGFFFASMKEKIIQYL
jgi:hypothetical protein